MGYIYLAIIFITLSVMSSQIDGDKQVLRTDPVNIEIHVDKEMQNL